MKTKETNLSFKVPVRKPMDYLTTLKSSTRLVIYTNNFALFTIYIHNKNNNETCSLFAPMK